MPFDLRTAREENFMEAVYVFQKARARMKFEFKFGEILWCPDATSWSGDFLLSLQRCSSKQEFSARGPKYIIFVI